MDGWYLKLKRAERSPKDLRAFFCVLLLLLPLYAVPKKGVLQSGNVGVDAPPPPVLESLPRLGAFGGLERRPLSGWPVASGSWIPERVWHVFVLPRPGWPRLKRVALAEFQQWQLEGG